MMKPQDAQKVFDREFPRLLRVTKSLVQIDVDRVRRENEEKSLAELDDLIAAQQRLDRLTEEDLDELARREELKRQQWLEESSSCMEDAHMEQEKDL